MASTFCCILRFSQANLFTSNTRRVFCGIRFRAWNPPTQGRGLTTRPPPTCSPREACEKVTDITKLQNSTEDEDEKLPSIIEFLRNKYISWKFTEHLCRELNEVDKEH
ncbi:hypothetical protein AVEN_109738-1 [Araneus ventricosus]|uniref:Uncharacterized protein n=1 Tax=Araneus ventricosus TaxID=182803 RepID=A0A4Y2MN06_ARAVE|nr:hypothetical protein AVEN_109738-1 [Araneus ventricosus]